MAMIYSSWLVPQSFCVLNPKQSLRLLAISRSRSRFVAMMNEAPAVNRIGIPSRFVVDQPVNLKGITPSRFVIKEPENRKPRNFKEDPLTMEEVERFTRDNLHRFPRVYVDNYCRSMEQLCTYEGFVMDDLDLGPLPFNGVQQVQPEHNLDRAGVAAQYALEHYNKQQGMDLKLIRIVRANSLLAIYGIEMFITLEASDHCFYETNVCCDHLNEEEENEEEENEETIVVLEVKLFRPAKYCTG